MQKERYQKYKIHSNAQLTSKLIPEYCKLDSNGEKILEKAFNNLKLSVRAYEKILKIARTIADLDEEKQIKEKHIAEAIKNVDDGLKFKKGRIYKLVIRRIKKWKI